MLRITSVRPMWSMRISLEALIHRANSLRVCSSSIRTSKRPCNSVPLWQIWIWRMLGTIRIERPRWLTTVIHFTKTRPMGQTENNPKSATSVWANHSWRTKTRWALVLLIETFTVPVPISQERATNSRDKATKSTSKETWTKSQI